MFYYNAGICACIIFIGATYAIFKGRTWDRLILMNALFPIVFFTALGVSL